MYTQRHICVVNNLVLIYMSMYFNMYIYMYVIGYFSGSEGDLSSLHVSMSKIVFLCLFYSILTPASLYLAVIALGCEICVSRYVI